MLKKIIIASAAAAFIAAPAYAGGHGGKKDMAKMDCAAKIQKLEKKGMKGEKFAMLREQAMQKMKAGDEKGCLEIVSKMKKAGEGYGSKSGGYGK